MADANTYDWSGVEQELKNKLGDLYTPGALQSVQANASYGSGDQVDPNKVQDWTNRIAAKESLRADNEPNSTYTANGQGGYTTGPTGNVNTPSTSGSTSSSQPSSSQGPSYESQLIKQLMDRQAAQDAENKQRNDNLFNMWNQRATQSLAIDRNDPIIRAQADAYSAQQERARNQYLQAEAERQGPYANLGAERRLAAEHAGQASGAFEAQLLGKELEARRNEIAQALTGMAGLLTTDQAQELQRQLALLDQAVKQQQLAQGSRGLDLQSLGLSNDWQRALLQNEQFYNNLGFEGSKYANYNDLVRSGLLNG